MQQIFSNVTESASANLCTLPMKLGYLLTTSLIRNANRSLEKVPKVLYWLLLKFFFYFFIFLFGSILTICLSFSWKGVVEAFSTFFCPFFSGSAITSSCFWLLYVFRLLFFFHIYFFYFFNFEFFFLGWQVFFWIWLFNLGLRLDRFRLWKSCECKSFFAFWLWGFGK